MAEPINNSMPIKSLLSLICFYFYDTYEIFIVLEMQKRMEFHKIKNNLWKEKKSFVFYFRIVIFIGNMESRNKILKSKRLKLIRGVMYLDVLSILLSVMMIDMRHFTFSLYSGVCMRILVLLGIFILLLIGERSLTRYLRKHRNE